MASPQVGWFEKDIPQYFGILPEISFVVFTIPFCSFFLDSTQPFLYTSPEFILALGCTARAKSSIIYQWTC